MFSCRPTQTIEDGQYLYLTRIKTYDVIGSKTKDVYYSSRDLCKTNTRFLFFRPRLKMYEIGKIFNDSSWINHFLTQNIGEAPVLYDSVLMKYSAQNIEKYLQSIGYFSARVETNTKLVPGRKLAFGGYKIYPGKPYYNGKLTINVDERDIKTLVQADLEKSKIKEGEVFNIENLKAERDRVAAALQNSGYYYLSPEQVHYEADSLIGNNIIDISMSITKIKARSKTKRDSIIEMPNRKYRIGKVYFNILNPESGDQKPDTLAIDYRVSSKQMLTYYFIYTSAFKINPNAIIRATFIKPGAIYKKIDVVETHKSLTQLNNFRLINIAVHDVSDTSKNGTLNMIIQLSFSKKYTTTTSTEAKNSGGALGFEQNFSFSDVNLFRNAEILSMSLRGAIEMQSILNSNEGQKIKFNNFDTYEGGLNINLDIPRFFVPFQEKLSPRYIKPRTKIQLGFNFQQNPDYRRFIINTLYGYTWRPNSKKYNSLHLIEISTVRIFPTDEFKNTILNYKDPKVKYSYQNHLVVNTRFAHTYSEQRLPNSKPYKYWFYNIDVGGVPYVWLANVFNASKDSVGQTTFFNIPFSQYVLGETEFRYFVPMGQKMNHAFRIYTGIGIPFGGTPALPFEKSFYVGGSNSLRAWSLGGLGPGTYIADDNPFEKTGDVKLELNYEFRFPLFGSFEGALFTDAGNIWLLHKSSEFVGGELLFPDFIKQMAIDFGYGIRYNLDYLIIRLDIGHPLYQPYLKAGDRWSSLNTKGKLIWGFNFAIGYPF